VDTGIGQLLQLGDDAFGVVGNIERGTELDGGDFQFHGLSEEGYSSGEEQNALHFFASLGG
jgi:hypothetical protein